MKCDLIHSICQDKTDCTNGVCGPTVSKKDGAACVVGDGEGNTLPGEKKPLNHGSIESRLH